MAANLCWPRPPPSPHLPPNQPHPSCNYAAVAESNLETVDKHGGRYPARRTRPLAIKSLSDVGKTTVNWLFNHLVYVSNPVRVGGPERNQLPDPRSPSPLPLPLPPLQHRYANPDTCKAGGFRVVRMQGAVEQRSCCGQKRSG